MFRTWTGSLAKGNRRRIRRDRPAPLHQLHRPLRLEPLEDRLAPAVHTWTGAVDGSWSNDANWAGGSPAGDMTADLVFPSDAMNLVNTNDIETDFGVHSITFSGDSNYTSGGNALTLDVGGILLDSTVTSATDTLTLDITLSAAQTWSVTEPNATLVVNGVLSGGAGVGLTKAADGTLTLAGGNALFQGGVTLNAGIVLVGDPMALGTGPATLDGGTLEASTTLSLDNAINVGGPATIGGDSDLTFTGAGTLNAGSTLTVNNTAMTSFSGILSGTGGLTDAGTGTLILTAPNTYTGPTAINDGTLQLGVTGGVPSNSAMTVAAGATFDLNNFSDSVASLTGAGDVTLGSGNLSVGGDNTNTTFAGIISGAGSLTKIGTGTLTLTGNNTYMGATLIVAGTLLVNGSQPSSDITVDTGGTLGGSGTVGAITSAGTVSPGGPGTALLSSGNVVLSAFSTFTVTLNGVTAGTGYDQLSVTGTVDLTAFPNLMVNDLFPGIGADTFTIITATGGLTGNFGDGLVDNSTLNVNGQILRINYSANAVTLTARGFSHIGRVDFHPQSFRLRATDHFHRHRFLHAVRFRHAHRVGDFYGWDDHAGHEHFDRRRGCLDNFRSAERRRPFHHGRLQRRQYVWRQHFVASWPNDQSGCHGHHAHGVSQSFRGRTGRHLFSNGYRQAPGAGTPTGTVTFSEGTTMLGTGTLDSNGQSTFSTSSLALGSNMITAVYSGDTNFTTSTSQAFTANVLPPTMTTLTASLNPSVFGQAVTFTATVAPATSGTGTPTGSVTFLNGSTVLGTGTLSGGVATFTTSGLTTGVSSITANYTGDTMFGPSTSAVLSQMVNQASTTITLSASSNPSGTGQPVTFTATVAAVSPGAGIPTGTVTFRKERPRWVRAPWMRPAMPLSRLRAWRRERIPSRRSTAVMQTS